MYSDAFDTSEEFKNTIFKATVEEWDGNNEFINMFIDRIYYSQAADSLMKSIRVINLSTIYNVSKFSFSYDEHKTVTDTFVIPAGTIDVEVEGHGDVKPSNNTNEESQEGDVSSAREEDEGGGDEPSGGGTVDITSTGSNTEDVKSKKKYDYTVFTFKSNFLSKCLDRVCFMIDYAGDTAYYTLDENNVGIIEKDLNSGTIKIGVVWSQHKTLLEKNEEKANIVVYMKIKNEIKSKYGEGHMEFAFGFNIQGEDAVITGEECDPDNYIGGHSGYKPDESDEPESNN